jgi:DNA-binding transcriptional regulator YiaG
MTFKELRALSGMSQRAFAKYFGIPHRTVEDWERGLYNCSPYLLDLMQYKLEQEGIIPKEELT